MEPDSNLQPTGPPERAGAYRPPLNHIQKALRFRIHDHPPRKSLSQRSLLIFCPSMRLQKQALSNMTFRTLSRKITMRLVVSHYDIREGANSFSDLFARLPGARSSGHLRSE